jgi:hypothetical protein
MSSFLCPPAISTSLCPNILLNTLRSPTTCLLYNVDRVLSPHKATGKLLIVFILKLGSQAYSAAMSTMLPGCSTEKSSFDYWEEQIIFLHSVHSVSGTLRPIQ